MENHFQKSTGISLTSGALLVIITMVLHPSGGSLNHIIEISTILIASHALAIFSLPILLFGFYGLTKTLMDKWRLSMLAFLIIAMGLIAVMMAAVINGLTLPYYLSQYTDSTEGKTEIIKLIINYGFALNKSFDYIFMVATCVGVFIYSILIIRSGLFNKWIGYLGIFLLSLLIIGGAAGFVFTNLTGFRIFCFSIVIWFLLAGFSLAKPKSTV